MIVMIRRTNGMTKIEQLERDIKILSPTELCDLRDWFQSFMAEEWDKQIEADAMAGKFDNLAYQALDEHKAGRTKAL